MRWLCLGIIVELLSCHKPPAPGSPKYNQQQIEKHKPAAMAAIVESIGAIEDEIRLEAVGVTSDGVVYEGRWGGYKLTLSCSDTRGTCEQTHISPLEPPAKNEATDLLAKMTNTPYQYVYKEITLIGKENGKIKYKWLMGSELVEVVCVMRTRACELVPPPEPPFDFLPLATKAVAEKAQVSESELQNTFTAKKLSGSIRYTTKIKDFEWVADCNIERKACEAFVPDRYPLVVASGPAWTITRAQGINYDSWQLHLEAALEPSLGDFRWTVDTYDGKPVDSVTLVSLEVAPKVWWDGVCKEVSFYADKSILQDKTPTRRDSETKNTSAYIVAPVGSVLQIAKGATVSGVACDRRFSFTAQQIEGLRQWLEVMGVSVESPVPAQDLLVKSVKAPKKVKPSPLWEGKPPPPKEIVKPKEPLPTDGPGYYGGPQCSKGCPCGNACISCSKTCHK